MSDKPLWKILAILFALLILVSCATPSIAVDNLSTNNASNQLDDAFFSENITTNNTPFTLASNTYYVPDDYAKIQWAVDNATAGDTIIVRDSTYTENIDVNVDNLTIQSENGSALTIVQAANSGDHVFEVTADYVNISGFTVTETGWWGKAGVYLESADYCTLSNNNVSNNEGGEGIYLMDSNYNSITKNNISNNGYAGIYLEDSINNNITNNNLLNNGLFIYFSYQNTVKNNTINDKPLIYLEEESDYTITEAGQVILVNCNNITVNNLNLSNATVGVELWGTNNSRIMNNKVLNNDYGIYLNESSNNNITSNIASSTWISILLDYSSNNTLMNNIASNTNYGFGITLGWSDNNTLLNNTANSVIYYGSSSNNSINNKANLNHYDNTGLDYSSKRNVKVSNGGGPPPPPDFGISLYSSNNNRIYNNNATNRVGIYLEDSSGNMIANNNASNNHDSGIHLWNSSNNNITSNIALNNDYGIYLDDSSDNTIVSNKASKNDYGVCLEYYSSNNTVTNNNASNNGGGISLSGSSNNNITNNVANSNRWRGIDLFSSSNNTLTNNTMSGNEYNFFVHGWKLSNFIQNMDASNKVDGKPVYYWVNEKDKPVPSDAGFVGIVNSTNISVRDLTLTNNGEGVLFASSRNSRIENITVSNSAYGIYLYSSNTNILMNIIALNNVDGLRLYNSNNNFLSHNNASDNNDGIYLYSSSDNEIINNIVAHNGHGNGIHLYNSSNNSLSSNNVSNNYDGIYLHSSSNNTLLYNNINSNSRYGIGLMYRNNGSKIYLNNFINNGDNVHSAYSTNIWNSTEKISYTYNGSIYTNYTGNYWDDYTDVDVNGDGIWDNPYSIDGDKDNYPLKERFENYVEDELLAVPFFSQRDPAWSDKKLDHSPYSIGEYGCALTSAAMVAKYFGYDTDPDMLNTSLTEVGGLDITGDLHWEKVEEVSGGKVTWIESVGATWSRIDQELNNGNPVISSVDCSLGNHFIVFIGKIENDYYFLDPYDQTRTLNKWPNGAHGEYILKNLKIYHGISEENQPPNPPTILAQLKSDSATEIPVGNTTDERIVIFKGTVSDPDGDKVKLRVELRRLEEYGGQFDETKGGLKESVLVENGSEAAAYAYGLIDADYHWRARAVDEHGEPSNWVDFGDNDISEVDFTVKAGNPPTARAGGPYYGFVNEPIQLHGEGTPDKGKTIEAWEWTIYDGGAVWTTDLPDPVHTWNSPEDGVAFLKIQDSDGMWSEPNACNVHISDSLLEKYAPVLLFDMAEKFYPTKINALLDHSVLKDKDGNVLVDEPVMVDDLIAHDDEGNYLDMTLISAPEIKERLAPDSKYFVNYPSNIYARLADDVIYGGTVLQYWIFYPYNHYTVNAHEGDMEIIQILLDSCGNPDRVTYSCHYGANTFKWKSVYKIGTHPIVSVECGSHGNYVLTALPPWDAPIGKILYPKGADVQKFNYLIASQEELKYLTPIGDQTQWANWKGKWGEQVYDGKGELIKHLSGGVGPKYAEQAGFNVWEEPVAWMECYDIPIQGYIATWIYKLLLKSPVNVHIYDQNNNHVGINENGTFDSEIPGVYYVDSGLERAIYITNVSNEYMVRVEATDGGEFGLDLERKSANETTLIQYLNISITENTTANLSFNQTSINYTMEIDTNGDGDIDINKSPDSIDTNYAPTAIIISPFNNSIFFIGDNITFNGTGADSEDGTLTNSSLVWSSSINGVIGFGNEVNTTNLPAGLHFIELMVNDSGGQIGLANVTIEVIAPDLAIDTSNISFSKPSPVEGESITINATVHNIGTANATNVTVQFFAGTPINGTQIGANQTLASINAGETKVVSVVWNTTGEAGDNSLWTVVDPTDSINEINEENNQADKRIFVNAPSRIHILQAQTESATYIENECVLITCIVQNASGNISANVSATIQKPVGIVDNSTLMEGMAGNYNGLFLNTSLSGTYNVTISANRTGFIGDNESLSFTVLDTTPPTSITNMTHTSGTTWINWTWDNPIDPDFGYTLIYLNGTWKTATSTGCYLAEGLNASTEYEIETRTVDTEGNINKAWINQTAMTSEKETLTFDTKAPANPYPSIMGNHTGTIKPNHTVIATKLYTYPCEGTGGHTEYAEIRNATWNATATWKGYAGDWHNITFDKSAILLANETYNYTIRTGSYPQIHHNTSLQTANGWINCTKFTDANGKEYNNGIPAIRLWIR